MRLRGRREKSALQQGFNRYDRPNGLTRQMPVFRMKIQCRREKTEVWKQITESAKEHSTSWKRNGSIQTHSWGIHAQHAFHSSPRLCGAWMDSTRHEAPCAPGKARTHDTMRENLEQTYMMPAASKNNVYFTRDFVGRTIVRHCSTMTSFSFLCGWLEIFIGPTQSILFNVDPTVPEDMSQKELKEWNDAYGRSAFSAILIIDELRPGMLSEMTEST